MIWNKYTKYLRLNDFYQENNAQVHGVPIRLKNQIHLTFYESFVHVPMYKSNICYISINTKFQNIYTVSFILERQQFKYSTSRVCTKGTVML